MNRKLLMILAVLAVCLGVFGFSGNGKRKTGNSVTVPGLRPDGYGNEETIGYLKSLGSFEALPDHPRLYFSADASGEYPLGDDANPCTPELPCRSWSLIEDLLAVGNDIIVLDAWDSWDTAADWGEADDQINLTTAACNDDDALCAAVIGSDESGTVKATINCNAMQGGAVGSHFFQASTVGAGWLGFANLDFVNCPSTTGVSQDLFRHDVGIPILAINVWANDLIGDSNQYWTSHNTTAVKSHFIAINPSCTLDDGLGECFRPGGNNADVTIIGGYMANNADADLWKLLHIGGGVDATTDNTWTVLGTRFSNRAVLSGENTGWGVLISPNIDGEHTDVFIGLSGFEGFTNPANAVAANDASAFSISVPGNVDTDTTVAYVYRTAFSNNDIVVLAVQNGDGQTDIDLVCALIDGTIIDVVQIFTPCTNVEVDGTDLIYDESVAGYSINGATDATAANFITRSSTASCLNAPWTWGGTEVSTDQFGVSAAVPLCQASDCRATCDVSVTRTLPRAIPAFVVGQVINGFSFPAGGNAGP